MAELEEMFHSQPHTEAIVGCGGAHRQLELTPVHQHELDPGLEEGIVESVVAARGRGDDAVHLPRTHRLNVAQLALRVVIGVYGERRVAACLQVVFDATEDRREERIRQVRNQYSDCVGAVGLEPACYRVRLVAELIGRLQDAPGGLLVH